MLLGSRGQPTPHRSARRLRTILSSTHETHDTILLLRARGFKAITISRRPPNPRARFVGCKNCQGDLYAKRNQDSWLCALESNDDHFLTVCNILVTYPTSGPQLIRPETRLTSSHPQCQTLALKTMANLALACIERFVTIPRLSMQTWKATASMFRLPPACYAVP